MKEKVIFCETEEEKNKVLEKLEKKGVEWRAGQTIKQFNGVFNAPMYLCVSSEKTLSQAKSLVVTRNKRKEITAKKYLKKKKKPYNCKVVCLTECEDFVKGNIYEVKDGKITTSNHCCELSLSTHFKSFDDITEYFKGHDQKRKGTVSHWSGTTIEFIEVVE